MRKDTTIIKEIVLNKISKGGKCTPNGKAKYSIGNKIVHVRYCSTGYRFNINPNTLSANYEMWICGNENDYYLIPIEIIKKMYHDSDAYIDKNHTEIRVVSVDTFKNQVQYAKGGKKVDISPYFRNILD